MDAVQLANAACLAERVTPQVHLLLDSHSCRSVNFRDTVSHQSLQNKRRVREDQPSWRGDEPGGVMVPRHAAAVALGFPFAPRSLRCERSEPHPLVEVRAERASKPAHRTPVDWLVSRLRRLRALAPQPTRRQARRGGSGAGCGRAARDGSSHNLRSALECRFTGGAERLATRGSHNLRSALECRFTGGAERLATTGPAQGSRRRSAAASGHQRALPTPPHCVSRGQAPIDRPGCARALSIIRLAVASCGSGRRSRRSSHTSRGCHAQRRFTRAVPR